MALGTAAVVELAAPDAALALERAGFVPGWAAPSSGHTIGLRGTKTWVSVCVCVCVCVSGKEGHPIGLRGTKQHPISTGNMPHGVWGVAWS